MSSKTITVEVPIEDCFPDVFGEETEIPAPDERDESDEKIIDMTKDIKRSEYLRERAEERLNEKDLQEAEKLLWIDEAEVYSVCYGHYEQKRDGEWSGFTENPNYEELRQKMRERLSEGVPCSSCRSNRINELKEQIEGEVEIGYELIEQ